MRRCARYLRTDKRTAHATTGLRSRHGNPPAANPLRVGQDQRMNGDDGGEIVKLPFKKKGKNIFFSFQAINNNTEKNAPRGNGVRHIFVVGNDFVCT